MSKNFLQKVIVTLVTVALLCTAFAITSFAALSIEGGKLVGNEDDGTYTAKQVLSIKSDGKYLVYSDTSVPIDGTENLTAGLWQITRPDTTTVILYSEGSSADRRKLGTIASETAQTFSVSDRIGQFHVGYWTSPQNGVGSASSNKVLYNYSDTNGNYRLRPRTSGAHLGTNAGNKELATLYTAQTNYNAEGGQTDDNRAALLAAQATIINKFNSTYNTWYAYTPEEMIPANEVYSFTYKTGFYGENYRFFYSGDDVSTKVELLTATVSGGVKTYTWTVERPDGFLKNTSKNNTQTITIDFTKADDNGNTLPADEYVVAMKVHPYVGMQRGLTEPGLAVTNVTGTTYKYNWATSFYPAATATLSYPYGYVIKLPKADKPDSSNFNISADGVVTVVNTTDSYMYASSDAEGNYDPADLKVVETGVTTLTAGYWAFVRVPSDTIGCENSDPIVLTHSAQAPAPAILIDKNGNFVLDTEAEGYNAEFEYEFLITTTDTDLENLDTYTWTTFNPVGAKAQEAGETYLVRVKADANNDLWTASDATEAKSPKAILLGVNLVLDGGRIGIKFTADAKTVNIDEGKGKWDSSDPYAYLNYKGGRCTPMNGTFTDADGDGTYSKWVYFNNSYGTGDGVARFLYDEATTHCNYTVYVSPKDYETTSVYFSTWRPTVANDTDKVAWPSGQTPSWGTHTVKTYIDNYKAYAQANPDNVEIQEALPLVLALEEYCMNAENYFDKEATALDAVEAVDADIANAPEKTKDGTLPEGIEFYGTSLMLEDRTQIRYYFTVDSSLYTVEEDGTTITWNEGVVLPNADKVKTTKLISNGVIFYESAAITADKLGDSVTETFTTDTTSYTVVYSPLNYIAETYQKDAKTANLAKALYNYYKAADAYVK